LPSSGIIENQPFFRTRQWLEGYVPVVQVGNIPAAGAVIIVDYAGKGILMSSNFAIGANPVNVEVRIDGVVIMNVVSPEVVDYFVEFNTALFVRMVSGGAGGAAAVIYLHT